MMDAGQVSAEGDAADFIQSEKAFTGAIGIDWLPIDGKVTHDGSVTSLGLSARSGLQMINAQDEDDSIDSENEFWNVGLTFRTGPAYRFTDPNPLPYAYASVLWGKYDAIGDHAITLDGMIRFVPDRGRKQADGDDPWGLFIGVRAVVDLDEGDDDLRLQVGVQDGLAFLRDIFSLTNSLFGEPVKR